MITYFTNLVAQYVGLDGLRLHIAVAAIFAFILQVSVIIVGFLINKLEIVEYRVLARLKGHEFAIRFCNYFTFPGVMLHELSHAFILKLTGARITKICLFKFTKSNQLGYVNFMTRGSFFKREVQVVWSSCAPVMMGYLYLYFLYWVLRTFSISWYGIVLIGYLMISIFNHMSMSNQDLKNYIKGSIFLFPVLTILLFLLIFLLC